MEFSKKTKYHSQYLCELINYFSPNGTGAEIGVYKGANSKAILTYTDTKNLFMVDSWLKNFDTTHRLYTTQGNPEADFKQVTKFFNQHFPERSTIICKKSADATNDVENGLDWIFIDASHAYKAVKQDLLCWVPKVKSGGLIAGHDWWGKFPGVIKAVTEFSKEHNSFKPPTRPKELPKYYIPAPGLGTPIVMKSWPHGHLWWAIKN